MDALIVLFLSALICLFSGFLKKPLLSTVIALFGLTGSAFLIYNFGSYESVLSKYQILSFDFHQINFAILSILFTMLIILSGYSQIKQDKERFADVIALMMVSLCGAFCLIGFTDLSIFFLGLEILSIPLYILAGTKRSNNNSVEASIKYFFTGAFITCFLLFGIALVYGSTGSFDLVEIKDKIDSGDYSKSMLYVGLIMLAASFLFKVGAVPFHFWAPDVYQGSPDSVTAFMASVVKVVMLYTFFKFFSTIFSSLDTFWTTLIYISIILSLFVGYLAAITQKFYKRLIAYSSITHSAFALFSLMAINNQSVQNLFIFSIGYGFSVIALISISMAADNEKDEISYFKGISRSYPIIGVLFVFAFLSLTGIPPFTGFFGKSLLFYNAFAEYPLLVLFGLISTAIGGYFYVNLIFTSYSSEQNPELSVKMNPLHYFVLVSCAIGILFGWLIIF